MRLILPGSETLPTLYSSAIYESDVPTQTAITISNPPVIGNDSGGVNITSFGVDSLLNRTERAVDYMAQQRQRYDYILNTPLSQLQAEGYTIDKASDYPAGSNVSFGNIAKNGVAWLPIQDTQAIENERGTAGTMMLKWGATETATQTAGFEGGGNYTGGSTQVTQPIPQVIPPAPPPDQPDVVPPSPGTDTGFIPGTTPTTVTTGQSMTGASSKYGWLWYVIAAVAIILFLKYGRK